MKKLLAPWRLSVRLLLFLAEPRGRKGMDEETLSALALSREFIIISRRVVGTQSVYEETPSALVP
jgi:hypothetical protein